MQYEAGPFTCKVCRHVTDASGNCNHPRACVVNPATRGANTTQQIRDEIERQKRAERNSRLRWGIPVLIVLVPVTICLCVVAVRVFLQR